MIILFDNYNNTQKCQSLWGFSAYFQEHKLLFDTGSNGRVLLKNMRELCVDVMEIEYIFITHAHWDHIGGLDSIIELNPNVTLFVPASLSKHLIKDLKSLVQEVILCTQKPMHLFDNLYTTGLLGEDIPEQSLVIKEEKSRVITGCGHFGIQKIVEVANGIIENKVDFAIGGFHLLKSSREDIKESIESLKELGVSRVLPTHCSGDKAIDIYRDSFKENYTQGGIATQI